MSPSQVRNAIKKALVEIIDPKPKKSAINAMWAYFGSSCAFCGSKLQQDKREGHADHLVASASGGRNAIFNRVLACAKCNGDEKLDADWETFLNSKAQTPEEGQVRRQAILKWQKKHQSGAQIDPAAVAEAQKLAEEATHAFDQAAEKARALRIPRAVTTKK